MQFRADHDGKAGQVRPEDKNDNAGQRAGGLSVRAELERLAHAGRSVRTERAGDVRVALGLAELGVAEDLRHDTNVLCLVQQERRRRLASVVDACVYHSGCLGEGAPAIPVIARVDRRAGLGAED